MKAVLPAVLLSLLAGCADHKRGRLECRFADASTDASYTAVRRAAVDFGSAVIIDEQAIHVLTAGWRATLTGGERKSYARDITGMTVFWVVTLPLQLISAPYGGMMGGPGASEVPETLSCRLSAVILPVDQNTSEIRVLIKRAGSGESVQRDFDDFWELVARDVTLQSRHSRH